MTNLKGLKKHIEENHPLIKVDAGKITKKDLNKLFESVSAAGPLVPTKRLKVICKCHE